MLDDFIVSPAAVCGKYTHKRALCLLLRSSGVIIFHLDVHIHRNKPVKINSGDSIAG